MEAKLKRLKRPLSPEETRRESNKTVKASLQHILSMTGDTNCNQKGDCKLSFSVLPTSVPIGLPDLPDVKLPPLPTKPKRTIAPRKR